MDDTNKPTTSTPTETPKTDVPAGATPPPPATAEPSMESLLGGGSTWTPSQPAGGDVPPPTPEDTKKNKKRGVLVAIILLLLLTLPIIGYVGVQQSQDIRDRAAAYPTGACRGVLQACDDANPCCGGLNLVCTGTSGSRVCNQTGGEDLCPGGTCGKINAYRCGNLSGGECHENLSYDFSSWSAAKAYTQGCGQVDEVCRGGSKDNLGCGSFEVVVTSCGGGGGNTPTPTQPSQSTPTNTPTRTPTPTVNPQCGGNCTSNAQCPNNHTCSAGKCVLSQCLQNGVVCNNTNCQVQTCGSTCGNGVGQCPNDHTCSAGKCVLTACTTGATCDATQCTVTNSPTPTRTPTPTTITGQCENIKIYKGNAVVNPNTLSPGDQIVIAVVGTNATKARVRVNGGTFTETSTKNSAGEYTLNFTIPASGTTTFTVEAELFIGGAWR